jgi:uncharacterized protein YggU (UPF0235/DUF167 family)
LVAKALGTPAGAVRVVAGHTGRLKQLEIDGVDPDRLRRTLGEPPA